MAKREKILVGLMVLALVYAAFELVFSLVDDGPPVQESAQVEPGKALEMAEGASQALEKVEMEEVQRHILETATAQWPQQNPFAPRPEPLSENKNQAPAEDTEGEEEDLPEFTYTGYLEMGQTKMAVINGLEYQAGEQLQQEKYILVTIQPKRVIVKNQESRAEISVPYQGNGF